MPDDRFLSKGTGDDADAHMNSSRRGGEPAAGQTRAPAASGGQPNTDAQLDEVGKPPDVAVALRELSRRVSLWTSATKAWASSLVAECASVTPSDTCMVCRSGPEARAVRSGRTTRSHRYCNDSLQNRAHSGWGGLAPTLGTYTRHMPESAAAGGVRLDEARKRCTRWLNGHGRQGPAELLHTIPPDVEPDRYGAGGVVEALEGEVAELLGKEAALFLPTGTMAQQIALRIHADRRRRRTVVWHPACHLDRHEGRGYQRLHDLVGVPAGTLRTPLGLEDLEAIAEPPAALLLELPQRDLGGTLPSWDQLEAMVAWARERGAAVHLDGARLWEAAPFYGRPESEVARNFDTVYVSFYKGLGGIAGCCVAGPSDVIAEEAEWRVRHGGRAFALWPYAASALTVLRLRRHRMGRYWEHAMAIAGALEGSDAVRVLPDPPQSRMMHLELRVTPDDVKERAMSIAEAEGIWTFDGPFAVDGPSLVRLELSVGDATLDFEPEEVRALVERLAGG